MNFSEESQISNFDHSSGRTDNKTVEDSTDTDKYWNAYLESLMIPAKLVALDKQNRQSGCKQKRFSHRSKLDREYKLYVTRIEQRLQKQISKTMNSQYCPVNNYVCPRNTQPSCVISSDTNLQSSCKYLKPALASNGLQNFLGDNFSSRSDENVSTVDNILDVLNIRPPVKLEVEDIDLFSKDLTRKSMMTNEFTIKAGGIGSHQISTLESKDKHLHSGRISSLVVNRKKAFIKPENGFKEVECRLNDIVNMGTSDVILKKGLQVTYCLSGKRTSCGTSMTKKVFVKDEFSSKDLNALETEKPTTMSLNTGMSKKWFKGIIVDNKLHKESHFHLIKSFGDNPQNKVLSLSKNNSTGLPLIGGDEVEYRLNGQEHGRVIECQIFRYSKRSLGDLIIFMNSELKKFGNSKTVVTLLNSSKLFCHLSNIIFPSDSANVYYSLRLIHFVVELLKVAESFKSFCPPLVDCIYHSQHLKEGSSLFNFINYDNLLRGLSLQMHQDVESIINPPKIHEIFIQFFELTLKIDSSSSDRALPLLRRVSNCLTTSRVQLCLLRVIESMSTRICTKQDTSESHWSELTLFPSSEEFKSLLENDSFLKPVLTTKPYLSAEDYMNTYYRLMRAECFTAIQRAIGNLCADEFEDSDIDMYHTVYLYGFDITDSKCCLILTFLSCEKSSDRDRKSTQQPLMFGNLLCLSPCGTFQDHPIWATVMNHNIHDNDSSAGSNVTVQLCTQFNRMSDSEVMVLLWSHGGRIVMIESPVYFHSFQPVLESLRNIDLEKFPFDEEIVHCGRTRFPSYLTASTLVDASPVFPHIKEKVMISKFLQMLHSQQPSILDESQLKSMEYSLLNRVALIQGPPGCGKTFIGAKLAEIILSSQPGIRGPLLVLTYKNHALDEFLKHTFQFLKKEDVIRLGGRSSDHELDECKLKPVSFASSGFDKSESLNEQIYKIKQEIQATTLKIRNLSEKLYSCTQITPMLLLQRLNEEQLCSFLENADFKTAHIRINQRHRYKTTKMNKGWLLRTMKSLRKQHGLIQNFFQYYLNVKVNSVEYHFLNLAKSLMETWWPMNNHLKDLKDFQTASLPVISKVEKSKSSVTKKQSVKKDKQLNRKNKKSESLNTEIRKRVNHSTNFQESRIIFDNRQKHSQYSIDLMDLPFGLENASSQINAKNLWTLNPAQRIQLLKGIMKSDIDEYSTNFTALSEKLKLLQLNKDELEVKEKAKLLQSKKLIGVTIVGACINNSLLRQIAPEVVIVEEAAEVLEPSITAALSSSIKHLIMIGDHKQLRPQVNNFTLQRKYKFNVSMMERLIWTGYPYESLNRQNRMRPEFAELLKDIYPELENNPMIVENNDQAKCMEKSMFFWTHDCPESSANGYLNKEEVERIKYLTRFLIQCGVNASEITILGAYRFQTQELKREIHQFKDCENVVVHTIDNYQGDENKFVIVSLVRSNDEGNIGFLSEPNRRCVAQSRAKCGMYFVGNDTTFRASAVWKQFIKNMELKECVGSVIGIQCEKHGIKSLTHVRDSVELKTIVENPILLCKHPCGQNMLCEIHLCQKSCKSIHTHTKCEMTVVSTCLNGHRSEKECWIPEYQMKCRETVIVTLPCRHIIEKECYEDEYKIKCKRKETFTYPDCLHKGAKLCFQSINEIPCTSDCSLKMDCGNHLCQDKCGFPHSHSNCLELTDYTFPFCGHPSEEKKECSQPIISHCLTEVPYTGPCGHEFLKICHDKDPICSEPCSKKRECGHPCRNQCYQSCEANACEYCKENLKEIIAERHQKARRKINEISQQISEQSENGFSIETLKNEEPFLAEYQKIEDLVLKFIKPEHKWYPTVTKIEKVHNLRLKRNFEEAKLTMNRLFSDYKFHGTSREAIEGIIKEGFRLPAEPGMFGKGIYFATDSSKSAQEIYTKGSNTLLLCSVLLGNPLLVEKADKTLNWKKVKAKGCDSVFARRGTKSTGGVMNDEYIIYNNRQAYPKYIITFQTSSLPDLPLWTSLPEVAQFKRTTVQHPREFKPDDPYQNMYRFAEGLFYHMMASKGRSSNQNRIKEIDIIQNKLLEEKFKEKKSQFSTSGISNKVILAFHGTDAQNIDSILENNFQLDRVKRQLHGRGHYFSEFPDISLGYGQGLLLCELLPGSEYRGADDYPSDYHSKLFDPDASLQNSSTMIIIRDSDQILPRFVIHLM